MAVESTSAVSNMGARVDRGRASLVENFETFLTLLTAQLKNQDPLSPLDGNKFTEQLVQMSGVEQQLLTNDLLRTMVDAVKGGDFGDPVDMIGKRITAESSQVALTPQGASWSYELPTGASTATLEVRNAAGQTVWSGPADLARGRQEFTWDGKKTSGSAAAEGLYTLTVKAEDSAGYAMAGRTYVEGVVTGVETLNGSAVLWLGKTQVPLDRVSAVRAAG